MLELYQGNSITEMEKRIIFVVVDFVKKPIKRIKPLNFLSMNFILFWS